MCHVGFFVSHSKQASQTFLQESTASGPPGGASLLVNSNGVRPRYAGPKGEFGLDQRDEAAAGFIRQTNPDGAEGGSLDRGCAPLLG